MSEKNDYDLLIYELLHPVMREYSENNKFGNYNKIPSDIKDKGFLSFYSKLFSNLLWRCKTKINDLENLNNYTQFEKESDIVIINDLSELNDNELVIYDELEDSFFIYYTSITEILSEDFFNKSFLVYDGVDVFGIDKMVYDSEFTSLKNNHYYHYRLYLGKRKPVECNRYIITKTSALYYVAKNEGIELNLFNSNRVNVSLLKNASLLFRNKGSYNNVINLAKTLEAEIELKSYSLIPEIYHDILNELKEQWNNDGFNYYDEYFIHYADNSKDYVLFKGNLYSLKYEDYKIDYLSFKDSVIFTTNGYINGIIGSLDSNNKDKIEIDLATGFGSFVAPNQFQLFLQRDIATDFYTKQLQKFCFMIGSDYSKWKLKVSYIYSGQSQECVFNLRFNDSFSSGIKLIFETDSEIDFTNVVINSKVIYYEFWAYSPVSLPTKNVEIKLRNEVNSSKSKFYFDVYSYNMQIIRKFLPDNYVFKVKNIEFNGERTLF